MPSTISPISSPCFQPRRRRDRLVARAREQALHRRVPGQYREYRDLRAAGAEAGAGEKDPRLPLAHGTGVRRLQADLRERLGADTRLGLDRAGNGSLWVSFGIDDHRYWLVIDRDRIEQAAFPGRWLGWIAVVLALPVLGAWFIVHRLSRPLERLEAEMLEGEGGAGGGLEVRVELCEVRVELCSE